MEMVLSILSWCAAHYQEVALAVGSIALAIDGILVIIPGKDPMIFRSIGEFMQKISLKK